MLTYEEALDYLGIDYADDVVERNVKRAMAAADQTLRGAVGADVLTLMPYDARVKELVLIYTDDLYTNRGTSAKVSGATRQLVHTMEWQLKLELRELREAAAAAAEREPDTVEAASEPAVAAAAEPAVTAYDGTATTAGASTISAWIARMKASKGAAE